MAKTEKKQKEKKATWEIKPKEILRFLVALFLGFMMVDLVKLVATSSYAIVGYFCFVWVMTQFVLEVFANED